MNLTADVEAYYKQHFTLLVKDKQFHFASRLGAWKQDPFSLDMLDAATDITHHGDMDLIRSDLERLLFNPPVAKVNAAKARAPYFEKYPTLRGRMLALFRVRHLYSIYGIDARPALLELCSLDELTDLSRQLENDPEAITILSTYAINYIYLVNVILFPNLTPKTSIAEIAYSLGESYDTNTPEHIQLLIYLYTHCVIGATNFYHDEITESNETYVQMIKKLESLIDAHFEDINLDNKLEFLVCCRILRLASSLFERIYTECEHSLSPNGTYVVDTINTFRQSNKTSFSDSEHRNVLLIMSASPYPHASE
jgi:hypothetical protein